MDESMVTETTAAMEEEDMKIHRDIEIGKDGMIMPLDPLDIGKGENIVTHHRTIIIANALETETCQLTLGTDQYPLNECMTHLVLGIEHPLLNTKSRALPVHLRRKYSSHQEQSLLRM